MTTQLQMTIEQKNGIKCRNKIPMAFNTKTKLRQAC